MTFSPGLSTALLSLEMKASWVLLTTASAPPDGCRPHAGDEVSTFPHARSASVLPSLSRSQINKLLTTLLSQFPHSFHRSSGWALTSYGSTQRNILHCSEDYLYTLTNFATRPQMTERQLRRAPPNNCAQTPGTRSCQGPHLWLAATVWCLGCRIPRKSRWEIETSPNEWEAFIPSANNSKSPSSFFIQGLRVSAILSFLFNDRFI